MVRRQPTITGVYPIRLTCVTCHLLVDDDVCVLIDTGLVGEIYLIRRKLRLLGRRLADIKAIVLTHGHLDHAGNLARLKELTGATVYAHADEQVHIDGRYPYTGISRVCGLLEAVGRAVLRYRTVPIDQTICDGDVLPLWGGLEVIHLPGHSKGHCGFYSAQRDVLFSGDLFISGVIGTFGSPAIFTSEPQLLPASYRRVAEMNPANIIPNHYDYFNPQRTKRRFDQFYKRRHDPGQ